jgi:uncharacterized damage-inducible protein DinB
MGFTMSQVPAWFERRFEFTFPLDQYPNVCIRLRGTPPRLEEMMGGISHDRLIAKAMDGKWTAQEHAGHLLDLEPLWMARVKDFLEDGTTLTVADLTNRRTDEAKHNHRELGEILARFREARLDLVNRLAEFQPALFARSLIHPRLKQPMRLVDHLYFVAEHDDHHLARIWEMIGAA